jgi:hypothetical protein
MKRHVFLVLLLFPAMAIAQIVKPGENFTNVYTFEGKVIFFKEIRLKDRQADRNYELMHGWMKKNYSGDPLNSSVDFKKKENRALAVSRAELSLSDDSTGIKAKMIMKYTLNTFIVDDICVMEMSHISFLNNAKENKNSLSDKISAEDLISDAALLKADGNAALRQCTRKSVLYFLNQLSDDFEQALSN